MAKLTWNTNGKRVYTAGVRKPVLFVMNDEGTAYGNGVSWSSISNVKESPSGGEEQTGYASDMQYYSISSKEEFKGTINAFWSPQEFDACDGMVAPKVNGKKVAGGYATGQKRSRFALAYVVGLGNDTQDLAYGYELHIIYNAKVSPSERERKTINKQPEPTTLSWSFSTLPVATGFDDLEETSHVFLRSTEVAPDKLKKIEDKLFGTDSTESTLVEPKEFFELLGEAASGGLGG